VFVHGVDVTHRVHAAAERERLLRQIDAERARLEALLRQMPFGVVVAEAPSGRLVKGNDHFERIFGHPFRPADDVSGYEEWVGFHEDGHRVAPQEWPLARAMKTGEEVLGEVYRYPRPDEPDAWLRLIASPVRDSTGRIVGGVVAAEDVTAQRAMAAALRASEEQLRQAQKMEAIGRLAGGVAHDFNNLLTVIMSYTSMLLSERSPEDPTSADLREVLAASERAASLTGQLLAFSRRQVLSPRVVDVAQVVGDMERMLRRLIGEDVELTVASDGTPAHTLADPGQLEQVVMNLAVNSRDAMPTGGHLAIEIGVVTLTWRDLERHPYAAAGEYVRVRVRDTGFGMDAHTLSQVFEPFFTTKELGKGTGLGLATVYGIVKQSGGYVWAESAPGAGTTFAVHLPRVADELDGPEVRAGEVSECPRTGATVLLVEDEDALRAIVARVLRKRGYVVVAAGDGLEALAAAERHSSPIDVLVTDVVMPKMSGQVLAERLAAVQGEIPVLFISGYSMDAVNSHGVLRPGAPLLKKPFTPNDIAIVVSELLMSSKG
jgi:PAS domain S-box-containing protein